MAELHTASPTPSGSASGAPTPLTLPPALEETDFKSLVISFALTQLTPAVLCIGFVIVLLSCHVRGGALHFCWGNFERAYCCCGCWYSRYLRVAGGSHREWSRAQFLSAKLAKKKRKKKKKKKKTSGGSGEQGAHTSSSDGSDVKSALHPLVDRTLRAAADDAADEEMGGGERDGAIACGEKEDATQATLSLSPWRWKRLQRATVRFDAVLTCKPRRIGQVGGGVTGRQAKTKPNHAARFTLAMGHVNAPILAPGIAAEAQSGGLVASLSPAAVKKAKKSIGSVWGHGRDPDGGFSVIGVHSFLTSHESPGRIAFTQRYVCGNNLASCEFRGAVLSEAERTGEQKVGKWTHVFRGTWRLQNPRLMTGFFDEGDFTLELKRRR